MDPRAPAELSGALTHERLRQVVDAVEEGVAILDAEGVIEFINAAAQEILRVPALEMIGYPLLDFRWEIVDENGRPLPRQEHPALRVLRTGQAESRVLLGMTSPAVEERVWVEVSAAPLPAEETGRPHGSVTTFRDVTAKVEAVAALRESELRFETLAKAVPVGIFHARDGLCVWTNPAWTAISGRSVEESLGAGWAKAIHPDDLEPLWKKWNEAALTGEPFDLQHRIRRPDGEVRWVLCRVAEIRDEHGVSDGFLGSVADITGRKAVTELKDQIIGIVSHELRAPLISIRGALTFLAPYVENADADGARLYEMAVRNSLLLERLVTDLLDIERLDGGRVSLERRETPVGPLLDEARSLALGAAEERGVRIAPSAVTDLRVSLDRDRVLQVLNNLVSNAVKFSEPGDVVRLEARRDDGWVLFSVSDEGRGIPVGQQERIFERFVQVYASDAVEQGGAGLGLAIARAVVAQHGGSIWVESEEGVGSTFWFRLPDRAGGPPPHP